MSAKLEEVLLIASRVSWNEGQIADDEMEALNRLAKAIADTINEGATIDDEVRDIVHRLSLVGGY